MRSFNPTELKRFLQLVDSELHRPCRIVLIGGGAIALAYHGEHSTSDLDLWTVSAKEFWGAVKRAQAKSPSKIPVQKAAIAQAPYAFEDRLQSLPADFLSKLKVAVPEAHDLVLMKTARAEAHDLDAIEDVHREMGLSLEILLERYEESKTQIIGSHELFKLKFQAVIARLFGEEQARSLESKL